MSKIEIIAWCAVAVITVALIILTRDEPPADHSYDLGDYT